jgi:lipopolysaccharide biosynthesis glycosyltransferase
VSTLHVSVAAEGEYVAHSAALLDSVLKHSGGLPVHVHYLHGPRMGVGDRELMSDMVQREGGQISFLGIDDTRVAGLPDDPQFTSAMWHRTFLDELLPDVDRVLYLDVDTIVMDDLKPLWSTNLEGNYLAAVTNVFERRFSHRPGELGLQGPEVYFNSGVLLLNLRAMRVAGCGAAVRSYAMNRELEWPDQDALNVILGGRRADLAPRWNAMNSVMNFPQAAEVFSEEALAVARSRPAIRHFEGPGANKPWHYLCAQPFREIYLEHRARTPWPDVRLEGATPTNFLRRLGGARRRPPVSA